MRQLPAVRVPGKEGIGRVLAQLMTSLAEEHTTWGARSGARTDAGATWPIPVSATSRSGHRCRWGFPHPAEFSRTFRAAVGMPPSDYRRLQRERCLRSRTEAPVTGGPRVEPSGTAVRRRIPGGQPAGDPSSAVRAGYGASR
ncbi:hypothetical protein GCM10018785_68560 [Streptomyces longispororuber]|uniref:HTH araC/xylS-type domain-containing protein n=1 Tax=Streptomyces longispororuber TaxID=68230 RepID=A0A919A7Q1_9ACTN|nr:hypothetical protein GCM10018785_68560 [Streptomyces longispororuber]